MTTNGIRFVVHGTLLAGLAAFGCDGCGGSGGGGDTPPPPAAPAIGLSASSLTFASPAAGTTSAAQSILVTNTGTAALAISRIATAGNFTATNNCPASLAAGANCTVQVTFAPTTAGTLAGSLAITDDASGSPQSVTLAGTVAAGNPQHFIVGVDPSTATTTNATYNQPANWPSTAGPWNGKGAHFNPATQRIVFETYRADLVGGSIQPAPGVIRAAGVTSYFQAGPNTGTVNPSGTTALYVANKDGSAPLCIGCTDVQDGVNGVKIYKVSPSTTATPDAVIEQTGTIVYANQNKDLASWYPSGVWILFSVEMKTHALAHQQGNSEVGMFNDVWAVSPDGLTWVQLTDFASTWAPYFDPVAYVPYSSRDTANCATGTQYAPSGATVKYPYTSYSCSVLGQPPPAGGHMRITVANNVDSNGLVPVVWAENMGFDPRFPTGSVQHLARADIALSSGLPAILNYTQHLTPSPTAPSGVNQWSNPGGNTVIGSWYEPWSHSRDDSAIGIATDVFLPTSSSPMPLQVGPTIPNVSISSQLFFDDMQWNWQGATPTVFDITQYGPNYPYLDNGATAPIAKYGHWEEPVVFSLNASSSEFIVFASTANLNPAWNPLDFSNTFSFELWVVGKTNNPVNPAVEFTSFTLPPGHRYYNYPTAVDPADNSLFVEASYGRGNNGLGSIFKLPAPR